jgi:hypothetical protein
MADAVSDALVSAPGWSLPILVNRLIKIWLDVRAPIVAPLLQFAINVCLVMVTMLFVERMFMCGVMVFVKLLRRTPETQYKWEPINDSDVEFGNAAYPMVLVQIPMYNEREVTAGGFPLSALSLLVCGWHGVCRIGVHKSSSLLFG